MRKVVDLASARIRGRFAGEPVVKASIQRTLGQTYLGLGIGEQAEPALREALALFEKHLGPEAPETLRTASALGSLEFYLGRYGDAADRLVRAGDAQARTLGEGARDTLLTRSTLSQVRYDEGRLDEAREVGERVLQAARGGVGEDDDAAIAAASTVATVALDQAASTRRRRASCTSWICSGRRPAPTTTSSSWARSATWDRPTWSRRRYADAERVTADALARARRVLGTSTGATQLREQPGHGQAPSGKDRRGEPLYREDCETTRRTFGATSPRR
jgi:tetratricopeptide (TPR) repeat protein